MNKSEEWKMKVVGSRKPMRTLIDYDRLLRTMGLVRGGRGICPGGVYRFRSFEEANEWKMKMLVKVVTRR